MADMEKLQERQLGTIIQEKGPYDSFSFVSFHGFLKDYHGTKQILFVGIP